MEDSRIALGHSEGTRRALEHLRHSGTWALTALRHLGTGALRALRAFRHLDTQTLEHLGYLGTWALGHSRHFIKQTPSLSIPSNRKKNQYGSLLHIFHVLRSCFYFWPTINICLLAYNRSQLLKTKEIICKR